MNQKIFWFLIVLLMGIITLGFTASTKAAVSYDNATGYSATSTSPGTFSYTNNGTLLMVSLSHSVSGSISSITYNGVSLTQAVADYSFADAGGYGDVWYLNNPSTGANDIVITFSSGNIYAVSAMSYDGAQYGYSITDSSTGHCCSTWTYSPNTAVSSTDWLAGYIVSSNSTITAGASTTLRNSFGGYFTYDSDSNGISAGTLNYNIGSNTNTAYGLITAVKETTPAITASITLTAPTANATTTNKSAPYQFWRGTYQSNATSGIVGLYVWLCYETNGCLASLLDKTSAYLDGSNSVINFGLPLGFTLSDGDWSVYAELHDSPADYGYNILASSTPYTFHITGNGSQSGIVLEDCSQYSGALFSSSTLAGIFCNVNNGIKKARDIILNIPSDISGGVQATYNGLASSTRSIFPVNVFVSVNQVFSSLQATSSDMYIRVQANGTILSGVNWTILSSSSLAWVNNDAGFNFKDIFSKVMYVLTGMFLIELAIIAIHATKHNTGNKSHKK